VSVEIRRATARFTERHPGRATWHAFSFGEHYDPERLSFGPMVCHDEHLLGCGTGFETHRHQGLDIVTWVVSGALTHTDPSGSVTLEPGQVGWLHAGDGVEHSEVAAAPQTRWVQVWLTAPDDAPAEPAYAVHPVPPAPGEVVEALRLGPDRALHVARLAAGDTVTLPEAARRHVYVASGALTRSSEAEPLHAGDAFLFTAEDGDAGGPVEITAAVPTELLVWELPA